MAITINWISGIISIPKNDLTLIQSSPTEIRELNLNTFRLTLKNLEDDEAGMPHTKTHNHNTTVTVGGVTLARVIEILDPYTITFEDGQYAVNLVGANSNISDKTNVNQVSIRSSNSAGLVQTITDDSVASAVWNSIAADYTAAGTFGEKIGKKLLTVAKFIGLK